MTFPHPASRIKKRLLEKGINNAQLARKIGVTRQYLNDVLLEKKGVSIRLAVGLENTIGGSATYWMALQSRYDIFKYRREIESGAENGKN